MRISNYIWALYLLVFPFYFMKPGDPQIADAFGAILVLINLKSIILSINKNKFNRNLFLFVAYAMVVNTVLMLITRDIMIIKNGLYYVYGYFIIMFLYSKIHDKKFLTFTLRIIGICLVLQLILWPFAPTYGIRAQLFFSNPNQLALWALCMLIISNVFATVLKPKFIYVIGLALLSTFFIFISASKSALVGAIIFWIFFIIQSKRYFISIVPFVLIGFIILVTVKEIDFKNINTINNVVERLSEKNTRNNQGVQGRGYDRIYKYPQYLLLGAGEGYVERFNSYIELHSTFFSILFCYGIVGSYFFFTAILSLFKNSIRQVLVLFTILFLYTLMHMTLRSPMFWITLLMLNHLKEFKSLAINQLSTHDQEVHMHSWR